MVHGAQTSGASTTALLRRFAPSTKPAGERPLLKLCETCKGKGQTSYFNGQQQKTYEPCKDCSKGDENSAYSLGVKLKCTCMKESSNYSWLHASQARSIKHPPQEIKALQALQADLQHPGNALVLYCPCGAIYLCIDGPERKKISGDSVVNAMDKKYNREVAETLVENGIQRVLQPGLRRSF